MKVLGTSSQGYDKAYIVEVTHSELKAVFAKGYRDEFPDLKVGQALNLAEAPCFRDEIKVVCERMEAAYKAFAMNSPALLKFAEMVRTLPAKAPDDTGSTT